MKYAVIRTDTADAGIRKIICILLKILEIQATLENLTRLKNEFLN